MGNVVEVGQDQLLQGFVLRSLSWRFAKSHLI